jgi:hypothetical protein
VVTPLRPDCPEKVPQKIATARFLRAPLHNLDSFAQPIAYPGCSQHQRLSYLGSLGSISKYALLQKTFQQDDGKNYAQKPIARVIALLTQTNHVREWLPETTTQIPSNFLAASSTTNIPSPAIILREQITLLVTRS